jgi:sucrose-6-phosphate hydrolase SacC (GH32 family)
MTPNRNVSRRRFTRGLLAAVLGSPLILPSRATARNAEPPGEPKQAGESPFSDDELRRQAACFKLVYDSGSRYVNDHCFVRAQDGRFHLFHIVGPVGKGCYDAGSEISFGHAVSNDLRTWQRADDVLSIDPNSKHEPHHIFAPYVCEKDGTYYMFYAGINQQRKIESMCLACSEDLFHWQKHACNPVFRPSRNWAEYAPNSGVWGCCRDAHVIAHAEHGYILYYVTWIKGTSGQRVALGAAVSDNLVSWQDAGPVIVRDCAHGDSTTSMESPCVVPRNGRYYLFYKHRNETRLVVSENPLQFTEQEDIAFSIAHAAEIFEAGGCWYISSCSRELLDLKHAKSDRSKGLFLASIEWRESGPAVVPFGEG